MPRLLPPLANFGCKIRYALFLTGADFPGGSPRGSEVTRSTCARTHTRTSSLVREGTHESCRETSGKWQPPGAAAHPALLDFDLYVRRRRALGASCRIAFDLRPLNGSSPDG